MKVSSSNSIQLIRRTPLLHQVKVFDYNGTQSTHNILYKLENLQYSGSFKDRGISHMIKTLHNQNPISKLISASGGNAGNAVAVAGNRLGIPVEVYVPKTTLPMMIKIIESSNAKVFIAGDNWNEANEAALEAIRKDPNARYIPPFDDPLIWEGHSFMIDEINEQLNEDPSTKGLIPDAVVVCVGGGGLLKGVLLGLERVGWLNTKVYAAETEGAASFALAKKEGKGARLQRIDTIATTLGALQVTDSVFDTQIQTEPVVVSDADAVSACISFANSHRLLIEPSCGSSLSVLTDNEKFQKHLSQHKNILMVVCGGSAVSLELLNTWKTRFNLNL